jgi:hypothetical protein
MRKFLVLVLVGALLLASTTGIASATEINEPQDFQAEYLAAPAVAGMLLEAAGVDNRFGTGKDGGNYISLVTQAMGPGTDFNGVSKENIEAYKSEVEIFLNDAIGVNEGNVAKIDTTYYKTLKEAVAAVQSGQTVKLLANASGDGIRVPSGTNFTLDLGGFTYTVNGQLVGSTGTVSLGFQLLKGSNITIKNGGLTTTNAKMLIQNYSNLTLDNVDLTGVDATLYVLSNNNGATTLKNGTTITAVGDNVAFDVYYWPKAGYVSVSVEILTTDVVINGTVEYASDGSDTLGFAENAKLIIPSDYNLDAPTGYEWVAQDGKKVLN